MSVHKQLVLYGTNCLVYRLITLSVLNNLSRSLPESSEGLGNYDSGGSRSHVVLHSASRLQCIAINILVPMHVGA